MSALLTDLTHAVTRYDRAQARGRSYNRNALALYLGRCDEVAAAVARGEPLQAALAAAFSDRLLDRVTIYLRGLGYPVAVVEGAAP
jgi:hypothetical protein